jgi:RND family efflux transporter MFP subunit
MRHRGRLFEAIAPVALGAALAIPAAACHQKPQAAKQAVPVRVEAAQQAGAAAGVRYSANVQPREQVSLAFKSPGYVREILKVPGADGRPRNVQQGDAVKRGTVLARVRENDYIEKVNQARAQLGEATAAFDKQRLDYERAKTLLESKSLARADFDAASSGLHSAEAHVAGARSQLEAAEIALADCALTAPMDALVLSRSVEEGALVASGTPGFVLADTTSVKAVFGVPDTIVHDVKIGLPLQISIEAIPGGRFPGRVTAIGASAERESRLFDVEVTIANPDGRLRSGMIASVEAAPPGAAPAAGPVAVAVPLTAILKAPGSPDGYAVFVLQEGEGQALARIRDVKLGEVLGSRIAVTSGLAAGERVIVTGATIVNDGDPVRIIP